MEEKTFFEKMDITTILIGISVVLSILGTGWKWIFKPMADKLNTLFETVNKNNLETSKEISSIKTSIELHVSNSQEYRQHHMEQMRIIMETVQSLSHSVVKISEDQMATDQRVSYIENNSKNSAK
ncbi:MAG: hypothetical protein SFU98_15835 [Leptospiraceae bacterium]|nr:hypothetical protein [Leptospiraceae bacterium]